MTQKELETKIAKKTREIEKREKARSVYIKLRNSIPDIIKSYSMKEQEKIVIFMDTNMA